MSERKIPRYQTQFDPTYEGTRFTPTGESNTVPDMSLTVKQLLINHTRGLHSPVKSYEPHYFDQEIPRFDDLTDAMEHRENLKERQKELTKQIQDLRKAKNTPKVEDPSKSENVPSTPPKKDEES